MNGAEAGRAYVDITESAYKAYVASLNFTDYLGNQILNWEDLPTSLKIAWEAAIRQALYYKDVKHNEEPLDERRFLGWKPPQYRPNSYFNEMTT
jgi:hypothetical protein